MPHDQAKTDQLASSHLDGPKPSRSFQLGCDVRSAVGLFTQSSRGALTTLSVSRWGEEDNRAANQYLLRFVFLLFRGGGGVPAVQSAMQLATHASTASYLSTGLTRTAAAQHRSSTHCGAAKAGPT
jgi:hypothetical protein